jgi:hypothetical protein
MIRQRKRCCLDSERCSLIIGFKQLLGWNNNARNSSYLSNSLNDGPNLILGLTVTIFAFSKSARICFQSRRQWKSQRTRKYGKDSLADENPMPIGMESTLPWHWLLMWILPGLIYLKWLSRLCKLWTTHCCWSLGWQTEGDNNKKWVFLKFANKVSLSFYLYSIKTRNNLNERT